MARVCDAATAGGPAAVQVAQGGRDAPFRLGEAAREIGGLGADLIRSRRIAVLAMRDGFAEGVYAALCNTVWEDGSGKLWGCTWRCAGDIAAAIRGRREESFWTFHGIGGEGRVDPRVRAEFRHLGWIERRNVPLSAPAVPSGAKARAVAGKPVPTVARGPQPVECTICEWHGKRLRARSRPCPVCGARVDFR